LIGGRRPSKGVKRSDRISVTGKLLKEKNGERKASEGIGCMIRRLLMVGSYRMSFLRRKKGERVTEQKYKERESCEERERQSGSYRMMRCNC
jgi:hypothetical protein